MRRRAAGELPALRVRRLVAGYAGRPVLRGISFRVRSGEIVGVIGPNGSGKTTLLRCLAGDLSPFRGQVEVLGRAPAERSRRTLALVLAVVPQRYRLPAGFTVREVVTMGRHPHVGLVGQERDRDRQVVEEALAATRTLAVADRDVAGLSGGERQRVTLALGLAQEPDVLLLDEPTAHLDLQQQVATLELLARERRLRGTTAVAVLHDPNLAGRVCDRLVLLRDGRMVASGAPEDTLTPELLGQCLDVRLRAVRQPGGGPDFLVPLEGPEP